MSSRDYSVVEYYAEHERYRCGYCKSTDTNYSHGMWAHSLTVQDYQDLIDRGWRRSGRYCYKPTMHITCCPMYTIKCEALQFKPTKSQKKVMKRFHRFLSHGDTKGRDSRGEGSECLGDIPEMMDIPDLHLKSLKAEKNAESAKVSSLDPSLTGRIGNILMSLTGTAEEETTSIDPAVSGDQKPPEGNSSDVAKLECEPKKKVQAGAGVDASRPPCKKAKFIRLERKKEKLMKRGFSEEEVEKMIKEKKKPTCQAKSVEEFLNEPLPENPAHRLEIRLVRSSPPSVEFEQTCKQEHEVYQKYQQTVHGDSPEKCSYRQYTRFLVSSPLQVMREAGGGQPQLRIVPVGSEMFQSSLQVSHDLYTKYQVTVHKETPEECNLQTFCEFLVESPLQAWKPTNGPPQGYGSFHQQYWMDGRLIAVGVIDILPRCVSSVYFYYDPEMGQLSLGTYASLQELSLVRSLKAHAPALMYYYMGFYIHTCPKMRYKAAYSPSYLLCPETYTWHPVAFCKRKLDSCRYCRFEEEESVTDTDGEVSANEVLVVFRNRAMPYFMYQTMSRDTSDVEETVQYAQLVGMKCARRMFLVKN